MSKPRTCLVVLVLLTATPAAPLHARTIHVNNVAGDDRNVGSSPRSLAAGAGPTRSIGRALQLAETGDRIELANTGQPYQESISLTGRRHSGMPRAPFVLVGNGAVLDGALPIPETAWQPVRDNLLAFQPARFTGGQLFLRGRALPQQTMRSSTPLHQLRPWHWTERDGRIVLQAERSGAAELQELEWPARAVAITLYDVQHVIVHDLVIQRFRLDGINAHDKARQCRLVGITSQQNGRSGISVGGASRVTIEQSLLRDNQAVQLRTEGWSTTVVTATQLIPGTDTGTAFHQQGGRLTIDGQRYTRPTASVAVQNPLHGP